MKRNLLWIMPALIVGLALILGASGNRAVAQEATGDASAEADAGASGDQSTSSDAAVSGSAQSDTSAQADTQADTSVDASGSTDVDVQTSAGQDAATSSETQARDATSSTAADASAQTDVDASADRGQLESRASQRQQTRQADAARDDASADADASARGRADLDPSARGRTDLDARGRAGLDARGRADVDARGRFDVNRDRRSFRDRRDTRQRDIAAGIQFGRATDRGLAINTIERDSVFFDSGLRRGDVIVSYGGRPIRSHDDFRRWVVYRPGQRVPVVVLRDGRRETVYVTYQDDIQYQDDAYVRTDRGAPGYLGVTFDAGIRNAAVLANVHPGSPAEEAGLQPDDDILALNNQEIRSFQEALDMIRTMRPGDELVIDFARQVEPRGRPMEERTMAVLAARPAPEQRVGTRREVNVYRGGPQYDTGPYRYEDRRFEDRRFDDRRFDDRRPLRRRDIDDDGRLLDRDRDDDRGLLERVFD